jgi:hydrogenase expression/formation protein HypE
VSGDAVTLADGAGGAASRRLVADHIVPRLGLDGTAPLLDAATFTPPGGRLATTTDAHVVRPLAFPGGSIGSLAIHGTVNDLAAVAARALVVTVALVLEEGLPLAVLDRELEALAAAAAADGVAVVAGDTKVVERGRADGMYVVTTGVGAVVARHDLTPRAIRPGDRVLLSGPVADHGVAVLLAREDLGIAAEVVSDTASVWPVTEALLRTCSLHGGVHGDGALRCLRDPTRGGLATTLNELALDGGIAITIDEGAVGVRAATRGACELLGLDPFDVANEGCLVAVVAPEAAPAALAALAALPGGEWAAEIGEVADAPAGRVVGTTGFGGRRIVDLLAGDPLPRIC